ncbi:Multidrug resistance protein MdtA precursor [Candidatus Xiphinematobacter sp. Idaho Grape]|uniref:efflux RND transporter periplasmic adaptor subunit n=1 Tax=Candidatus Xiphinematobacter sp. Idaho Grape TaxID=1704307 RepID=UPI000705ABE7|nr:efflux RND transporter periplasmic adaptor subunit [Candidatus Xiphinematobacter sp. Idaho Grape]ALJ56715.1 Multidrug resistance protein MdtA precursor [Candidatus Xiphinematobacter sp. Idaho Grape]
MPDSPEKESLNRDSAEDALLGKRAPSFSVFSRLFWEKRKALFLLLFLLGTIAIWKMVAYRHQTFPPLIKEEVIPVMVVTAEMENFPIYLDGLGTVQAYRSVQVKARVSGQIREICFQEGQAVKEGDVVAIINPHLYQTRYNQALAKKLQTQAQLESARITLIRQQQLLEKAVLDQHSYDMQKLLVAQLEAAVQADEAHLENQKIQLEWTKVIAPIAGQAGIRKVDAGNLVTDGSTIVIINQISPIYVSFALPQRHLGQVLQPLMQGKKLQVFVLDQNNQTVLNKGVLEVLDNQINPATATFQLRATCKNTNSPLWPGQFVNVRFLLRTLPNSIVIPTEAIQLGPNGSSHVYVVGQEKRAVMRSVVTGPAESGYTLVQSGLSAGENVVVEGQYRLRHNSPVATTILQRRGFCNPP